MGGEIEASTVFQSSYKPRLTTVLQLGESASKRNQLILGMAKASDNVKLDEAALAETRKELSRGWADGPWDLSPLESGARPEMSLSAKL